MSGMRPLMEDNEIAAIERELLVLGSRGRVDVLEWGSGGSTVYFTTFMKDHGVDYTWTSIEYNHAWYEKIADLNSADGKVSIRFVPLDEDDPHGVPGGRDEYVGFPSRHGGRYDFVLVDGRFRRRCLLEAKKVLKPGGVAFLHDAERGYYHSAFGEYPDSRFIGKGLWRGRLTPPGPVAKVINEGNIIWRTGADPLLKSTSQKLRTMTGRRTRKILRTFSASPVFRQIEEDVRAGGFTKVCVAGNSVARLAITLGARNPGVHVTGVLGSEDKIREAGELNRYGNVDFRVGGAGGLAGVFSPEELDFVLLFEVADLVDNAAGVLDDTLAVLVPGGTVAATLPTDVMASATESGEKVDALSGGSVETLVGRRKGLRSLEIGSADEGKDGWVRRWNYFTFVK